MTFNVKEQAIIKWGQENGKSVDEIKDAIQRLRTVGEITPPEQPSLAETGQDVLETVQAVGEQFGEAGQRIFETGQSKDLNFFEKAIQSGSQAFRGGARAIGEAAIGVGKTFLPQKAEDVVSKKVEDIGTLIAQNPQIREAVRQYSALDPETKRNIDNALGFVEGVATVGTGGLASRATQPVARLASKAVQDVIKGVREVSIPKLAPKGISPELSSKLGAEVVKDIIPTRDALRDRFVANSLRLAPVEDLARIESVTGNSVGEWLGRYDLIQNTPEATLEAINKFKVRNYNLVRDSIALVDQRFSKADLPELEASIDFLLKDLAGRKSPEYQQAFQRLTELQAQADFDLLDAQYVKSVFDDVESVYKRTGDVRDAIAAQDKAGTIRPVRRFIEDIVSQEYPDINVRALNNNVQTAREISDAVIKRAGKADTASFFRLGDLAVLGAGNFYVPGGGYAAFFGKKIFESAPVQLRFAKRLDDWARTGQLDTKGLSPKEIQEIDDLVFRELGAHISDFTQ